MTRRVPCPPAPGLLEAYAARFDDLFSTLAQRRGFREYLAGRLLPRDRNKTLTCLAGTEPVVGAQHPAVQRLQFFLSESTWDHERVNSRRVELLLADPATAPYRARRSGRRRMIGPGQDMRKRRGTTPRRVRTSPSPVPGHVPKGA
ncbi:hypothetical protein [Streptomyces sp. NBC_01727]|uniref:hypothetical protein n=1 Tax=Streptomyces sp. NBC_01718 TaxID=2975919 RepID=UPI002E0D5091|nr:transposase [Streptomyces sp. NBC_01727]